MEKISLIEMGVFIKKSFENLNNFNNSMEKLKIRAIVHNMKDLRVGFLFCLVFSISDAQVSIVEPRIKVSLENADD